MKNIVLLIISSLVLFSCKSLKEVPIQDAIINTIDTDVYSVSYPSNWELTKMKNDTKNRSKVFLISKNTGKTGVSTVIVSFSIIEDFLISDKKLQDALSEILLKESETKQFYLEKGKESSLTDNFIEINGNYYNGGKFKTRYYKSKNKILKASFFAFTKKTFEKNSDVMRFYFDNLIIKDAN